MRHDDDGIAGRSAPAARRPAWPGWKVRVPPRPRRQGKRRVVRLLAERSVPPRREIVPDTPRGTRRRADRDRLDEIERRLAGEQPGKDRVRHRHAVPQRLEAERAARTPSASCTPRARARSRTSSVRSASGGTDNHLGDTASATYDREPRPGPRGGGAADARRDRRRAAAHRGRHVRICEICGKPIGAERFARIPWARLCIDDQRRAG